MEEPTLKFSLTPEDKRRIQDAYEQSVRVEERQKAIDEIDKYLRNIQPLIDAAHDLSDVLIVVYTMVMFGHWERLQDGRFIKEVAGTQRILREICGDIRDREIAEWNARIEAIIDDTIIGIHRLLKDDDKSYLVNAVQKFDVKMLRLPPLRYRG